MSERLLMGQELLGSEMSMQKTVSPVFEESNFTKEVKATLKAMSWLPQDLKVSDTELPPVCGSSDETLSELEKQLLDEQRTAQECLKDIASFWQEITTPAS